MLRETINDRHIVSRKTHSSMLLDSEVVVGDEQSVIGVAVEWRG